MRDDSHLEFDVNLTNVIGYYALRYCVYCLVLVGSFNLWWRDLAVIITSTFCCGPEVQLSPIFETLSVNTILCYGCGWVVGGRWLWVGGGWRACDLTGLRITKFFSTQSEVTHSLAHFCYVFEKRVRSIIRYYFTVLLKNYRNLCFIKALVVFKMLL